MDDKNLAFFHITELEHFPQIKVVGEDDEDSDEWYGRLKPLSEDRSRAILTLSPTPPAVEALADIGRFVLKDDWYASVKSCGKAVCTLCYGTGTGVEGIKHCDNCPIPAALEALSGGD